MASKTRKPDSCRLTVAIRGETYTARPVRPETSDAVRAWRLPKANCETYVVSDATATFDNTGPNGRRYASELLHDVALADLNGEFSTVVDTKTVLERAS